MASGGASGIAPDYRPGQAICPGLSYALNLKSPAHEQGMRRIPPLLQDLETQSFIKGESAVIPQAEAQMHAANAALAEKPEELLHEAPSESLALGARQQID